MCKVWLPLSLRRDDSLTMQSCREEFFWGWIIAPLQHNVQSKQKCRLVHKSHEGNMNLQSSRRKCIKSNTQDRTRSRGIE